MLRIAGRPVDVRVSTLPTGHGERVVLRLLDKQAGRLSLDGLGMPAHTLARLDHLIQQPHGIILVTGPTGSGKTTTLYAALSRLDGRTRNMMTVEDPIEYDLDGVGQTQVNHKIEMTFARALRAILRQDPDVIMIGEMRDPETIDTAMKAAETGHLLISTLHTPDAVSTIIRIMAMFPPDEQSVVRMRLAESLHAVVSQRLLPKASGQGRVVAAEVMVVTPTIRDLITENRVSEIRDYIADGSQYGMQTFDQHLTELVTSGEVTFETALSASTRPADFELTFRMMRGAGEPPAASSASRSTASFTVVTSVTPASARASSGLGPNPLGTGAQLPPIATSPTSHLAVTSPNPLGGDAVFGSGFESLFGS